MKDTETSLFVLILGAALVLLAVIFGLATLVIHLVSNYGIAWFVGGMFVVGCLTIAAAFILNDREHR